MRSGYCLRRTDDLETVDSKLEEEEAEMQEEQVRFASYSTFCEGAEAEKIAKIAENTQAIGELAGETEGLQFERESSSARTSTRRTRTSPDSARRSPRWTTR